MSPDVCETRSPLLNIDAAQARIRALVCPIVDAEPVPIAQAAGRILARSVRASLPLPVFDHAAVDGYAIATRQIAGIEPPFTLPIGHRITAGEAPPSSPTDCALRIFTGAPLPVGFDAVVMQEDCRVTGHRVAIGKHPAPGLNIRRSGEDVAAGETILSAGTRIDARHVALAAAVGAAELWVQRRLRAAVFSTGNELRAPGVALPPASIYDSNRPMIAALLTAAGFAVTDLGILPDHQAHLAKAIGKAAGQHDLLVSTGGVSVGDEDHIGRVMAAQCQYHERLWMAVKPGKPALFGQIEGTPWLGLPGNALAAFVAFLILGRSAVRALRGQKGWGSPLGCPATAAFPWRRKTGRDEFFPVRHVGFDVDGRPLVERLGRGGSARLRPLAAGDGLAMVAADVAEVQPNSRLTYLAFAEAFLM